ncbi:MAG: hypothetical protein NTZ49_04065 [Candidatus Parcubacteria bacterium]|nr:hypothetical protein [Candidatus Parcubacteria bacterium]
MKKGLIEIIPTWRCLDCGQTGNAEEYVPDKCPKCKSTRLHVPPIKKGGPYNPPDNKKY